MSSSGSDVDLDIQSPEDVRLRRGQQKNQRGNAKQGQGKGKPLVARNEFSESDDDGQNSPIPTRKGRKRPSDPKWDDDISDDAALALDSDDERPGPSRENQQNQPPDGSGRPKMTVVDSEDEDSEDDKVSVASSKKPANPRMRKRLSIMRQDSAKSGSTSTGMIIAKAPRVAEPTPDPETLKKIYSSCITMFQTQKITTENAFNIRFLDLMGDIIELPEFDKHDMLGAGRMLEAGAKIYVCRVDKTKLSVMDLASTLNMQQRNKKRNEAAVEQENGEDGEGGHEAGGDGEEDEDGRPSSKKKRKRKLRENQYIVEDISKISLPVEVDSCKGGARRAALKIKFQDFIENDIDFDYFNEYLEKVGSTSRPATAEDDNCLGEEKLVVTTAVVNIAEFGSLHHLPMILLEEFDKTVYDAWGKRLDEEMDVPENYHQSFQNQPVGGADQLEEGEAELMYVPQDQPPADYNEGGVGDNFDDDRGFANDTFVNDEGRIEGTQETVSSSRKLTSLQDFFNIYQAVKSSFGWCGPTFVKNQRFNLLNGGPKKPRTKKAPLFIDVKNIDKRVHNNKFLTVKTAKGVFDERNIERWSSKGRPAHPYLELDDPDEEYEEVLELINEEEKLEIPDLFRYFVDIRRNLLGSLTVAPVKQDEMYVVEMNKVEDDYIHEAGFEYERAGAEADFANDDDAIEFREADISPEGGFDGSFNFPISLNNLLMEFEQDHTQKTDTESIRFTKKPKPIDMHCLKRAILEHLQETLQFHSDGRPYLEQETATDFISLLKYVLNTVDIRTAEHMSISILAVGLLHVVVEKRLFVLKNPTEPINPLIVCRGSLWNHGENIPLPVMIDDDDDLE